MRSIKASDFETDREYQKAKQDARKKDVHRRNGRRGTGSRGRVWEIIGD